MHIRAIFPTFYDNEYEIRDIIDKLDFALFLMRKTVSAL